MIDWQLLIFNTLWIVGLSTWLAATSYHLWVAGETGGKLSHQFASSGFLRPFWLGLAFVGIGLAGTGRGLWESIVWIAISIVAVTSLVYLFRRG